MNQRLAAALSTLLPTTEQTLLLRACLDGSDGPGAWAALHHRVGDEGVATLLAGNGRLVPLLYYADRRDQLGPALAPELRRRLTAAALREKERSDAFRRGAHEAVGALLDGGWEVLVLRGAALAQLAYPEPFLRHCHDLDLMVRPATAVADDAPVAVGLGTRASLHRTAFPHPRAQVDDASFWARSEAFDFGGREARVMAPADLLVHVCGNAFFSETRDALTWVTDAFFTLSQWPGLHWELVTAGATDRHLGVALAVLLDYLRRELRAPIPADVLDRIRRLPPEPIDRDLALGLAWRAARRRAPSRTRAVLSARTGAPSVVRWRLAEALAGLR